MKDLTRFCTCQPVIKTTNWCRYSDQNYHG